jgi:glycosyltransferase involved in cell wall biosynthesis
MGNKKVRKIFYVIGMNGFLVPVSNPGILAERLCILLGDAKLRNLLGNAGRATIQERNDYNVEMTKMGDLYKRAWAN